MSENKNQKNEFVDIRKKSQNNLGKKEESNRKQDLNESQRNQSVNQNRQDLEK